MLVFFVGVDSAYAQTPAVNVTSNTANGTYTKGTIDVRLVSPGSWSFEEFSIVDGEHGFDVLSQAYSITATTRIGGSYYALVAAFGSNGVQIIDITDPANPVSAANITDDSDGFNELNTASSVTTTKIGTNHYALVAADYDDGVQIIDITDPADPIATASITNNSDGFGVLGGAYSVTTTKIGTNHYALVASYYNNPGVQIIDITDPADPMSIANITDGENGFDELLGAHSHDYQDRNQPLRLGRIL